MMGFMRRVDRCSFPALGWPGIRVGFRRQTATSFNHGAAEDEDSSGLVYIYFVTLFHAK
jgi:hypothetical protein